MTDLDIETTLRRGLAGYAETMVVTVPALDQVLERPASHRRQMVLAGIGVATAAATVTVAGVVLTRQDGSDVSTSPPGGATITGPAGCGAREAAGDTIARGTLGGERPWAVEVRGAPPLVSTWGIVSGQETGGTEHNVWSWAGMVNEGMVSWQLDVFPGGRIVYGEVPPSTASVEVRLDGGQTVSLCPVARPGIDAVHYAATALPSGPDIVEIVVRDAAGQAIARGDVAEMLPPVLRDGGYGFSLEIDPELVELPLGGVAAEDPDSALTETLASGELPSGRWSLRTGVLEGPHDPSYMVGLVRPEPDHSVAISTTDVDEFVRQVQWHATPVDRRLIVWGPTPTDVAEIVVTLGDGLPVSVATQPSGVDGFDVRFFATALPEGVLPTSVQGLAADGTVLFRVTDLEEQLEPIADLPPGDVGVILSAEPVG